MRTCTNPEASQENTGLTAEIEKGQFFPMNNRFLHRKALPSQLAVVALASAFTISGLAQQSGSSQTSSSPSVNPPSPPAQLSTAPKEGFWGHMNPFARKKWVHRQIDPINDRLGELDEVSAKNARDIADVDSRAKAGISHAQSTADQANQTATAAGSQAQQASAAAGKASGQVDHLNGTVNGLDQYHQVSTVEIPFRSGQPVLTASARKQLDDLAGTLNGRQGYILEVEAHAPAPGTAGMQSSGRLAEAVKRYLVTNHEIPVYRMHSVALGNAPVSTDEGQTRVHTSKVYVRVMENSLAATAAPTSPRVSAVDSGAERP